MKKRILAIILSVFLFVTVCPFAAFAGDADVAQIGSKNYASLADAIAAVPTDGTETTIKMIDDETINGNAGVTIAAGQKIILDLNGCTISNLVDSNTHSQVINNKGTLTIQDSAGNGKITNAVKEGTTAGDWWSDPKANYTTNLIENNGTVIMKSGTLENTAKGSICYAIDNNSSDGNEITCIIQGGLLKNVNYTPLRVAPTNSKSVTFKMTGGTIEGLYGIALNCNSSTDPIVNIAISGGTIKATDYAFYTSGAGNVKSDYSNATILITGGTFGDGTPTEALIDIAPFTDFIFGGTYTEDPSEYVPEKFIATPKDGMFVVTPEKPTPAVDISESDEITDDTKAVAQEIAETMVKINEATKSSDTKLENSLDYDAINAAAVDNGKGDIVVATSIKINLKEAIIDDDGIAGITFDVQPVATIYDIGAKKFNEMNIEDEHLTSKITFRLPLPESFKGMKVRVLHKGEFFCDTEVITDELGTYIELQSDDFSPYTVTEIPEEEPTPTPPASKPENKPAAKDASLEKIADTGDATQALGSVAFCVASILSIAAIEKRKRED